MLKPRKRLWPTQKPTQKSWTMQKYIWHTQPRKNYDLRKMLTHVKNILTHVTRATQVKIWPMQPTHSLNPRYYASRVI